MLIVIYELNDLPKHIEKEFKYKQDNNRIREFHNENTITILPGDIIFQLGCGK